MSIGDSIFYGSVILFVVFLAYLMLSVLAEIIEIFFPQKKKQVVCATYWETFD